MTLINVLFLGILPAGLLMWVGNILRERAANEKAGKYWFWFLMGGFGLSIVAMIIANAIGERVFNLSMSVLLPILFGFSTALSLHIFRKSIRGNFTIPISLLLAFSLAWITMTGQWTILFLLVFAVALTALVWLLWGQDGKRYLLIVFMEIILLAISIQVTDMNRISNMSPPWMATYLSVILYLFIPWAGIVLSALLIKKLLSSEHPVNWQAVTSILIMVAVLFLMIGYQAMLTSLWDVATDGLGWVLLLMTSSTIGIGSAMLIAWSMPRKRLWASVLFAFTIPLVLVQAHNMANYDKDHKWGTKPIIVTEHRADMIDGAIQRYYKKNNQYPPLLNDLTPWYLLFIPKPYIIPGQDWCYEGGTDRYRFGYVYREYFSTPASVKVHSSAGELFNTNWRCEDEAEPYAAPLGF